MSKADEASAPPPYEQPSSVPTQSQPPQQQYAYPPTQGYPPEGYKPSHNQPQGQAYPPQSGYAAPPGQAPYPQYQYTPVQPGTVVVSVQPQQPYNGPIPDDHCTFSILNTICCCFWIGIFAIIKSQSVRDAINRGDLHTAARLSAEAKKLNFIALGVGIAFNVIYIVCVVLYIMFASRPSYY